MIYFVSMPRAGRITITLFEIEIMTENIEELSIRAASWLGAACIRHYMLSKSIDDQCLRDFTHYVETAATAQDVPYWDAAGRSLAITGLGDPLPDHLQQCDGLILLVESVRELTASQIYGAFDKRSQSRYLNRAIEISGLRFKKENWTGLFLHKAGRDGWGDPIYWIDWLVELDHYGHNVLVDELVFHLEHGYVPEMLEIMPNPGESKCVYHFRGGHQSSLDVPQSFLGTTYQECKEITAKFPQLSDLRYQ